MANYRPSSTHAATSGAMPGWWVSMRTPCVSSSMPCSATTPKSCACPGRAAAPWPRGCFANTPAHSSAASCSWWWSRSSRRYGSRGARRTIRLRTFPRQACSRAKRSLPWPRATKRRTGRPLRLRRPARPQWPMRKPPLRKEMTLPRSTRLPGRRLLATNSDSCSATTAGWRCAAAMANCCTWIWNGRGIR